MKKWWVIGFLLLILLMTGCTSSASAKYIPQDIPQYSADQVVYIVQAKYPDCVRYSSQTIRTNTSVNVTYIGNRVWKSTITCPTGGYNINGFKGLIVYFYETNGSLWGGYDPTTKTLSSPR